MENLVELERGLRIDEAQIHNKLCPNQSSLILKKIN